MLVKRRIPRRVGRMKQNNNSRALTLRECRTPHNSYRRAADKETDRAIGESVET